MIYGTRNAPPPAYKVQAPCTACGGDVYHGSDGRACIDCGQRALLPALNPLTPPPPRPECPDHGPMEPSRRGGYYCPVSIGKASTFGPRIFCPHTHP